MHLCFVSRIPRFNKRKNQKRMFKTCFHHAEGHFEAVNVLMYSSFRCTMIERYRHTIAETPDFDPNILLY